MSNTNITKHFINGVEIRPKNADSIGFKLDWSGNPKEAELTVDRIVLVNKAYSIVKEHIDNGAGMFEGIPYAVSIDGFEVQYYIDLTENAVFTTNSVEVTIRRRKAVDYFFSQANALSFESLNAKLPNGLLNNFNVPYVIIKDNQVELLIMLSLSTYSLTKALIEGIQELSKAIADITEASIPVGIPPAPNVGAIISASLKASARLIYVIALIVTLINLIQQIMELIFPKVRYFLASKVKELLSQGCQYLGYQFESTLLDGLSGLTLLPVPMKDDNPSIFETLLGIQSQPFTKGYPTALDTTPTVGSLFKAVESALNAKTRILQGNIVKTEIRTFWYNLNGVIIHRTMSLQDKRENSWTYNFGDAWKRYFIHYQIDSTDKHTLDKIKSSDAEYSTEPVSIVNADLVNIKGLAEVNIPFSLGIRKDKLTFVESTALTLAEFADSVVNFFGGSSNLAGLINGRIGVLQISQQQFMISKLLYTVNGRQPTNYLNLIGADAFYINYHQINQVKENFKRFETERIKFDGQSFLNLIDNNVVTDQFGNQLELETFKWINGAKEAEIESFEYSDKASNTLTILIDD